VVEIPFDKTIMDLPWTEFLTMLQSNYGAAGFVCGEDFRFGYQGQGTAERLQEFCKARRIPCAIVPEQTLDGIRVSSTYIRKLLEQGSMAQAVKFLGHPHILTGTVVTGKHIGTTLGIPTANLKLPDGVAARKYGVYACRAYVEGESYLAVTNIGTRPTVRGEGVTVEAWLLDFQGDLYGKELKVEFVRYLRDIVKFDSVESLKQQLTKDIKRVKEHD
jgi:riboflavin kinase/FMN adenylyltransferase